MSYALYRARLALHTPFGTPLAGDTLFGQICWVLREAAGEAELTRCLDGYTQGRPWLVVSDGFPSGYLPKPTLPPPTIPSGAVDAGERKALKARRWVPLDRTGLPLGKMLGGTAGLAQDAQAYGKCAPQRTPRARNTLNRLTGTTGMAPFAPYTQSQTTYPAEQSIDLYLVLDDERLAVGEAAKLLAALGSSGFGRDASAGLGKFTLVDLVPISFALPVGVNTCWTLAPCAPQGLGFDGGRSYWRVLTRFGRHGNILAVQGLPFKTPVLLAATGALLCPRAAFPQQPFVGQGLGGDGRLSKALPATVHQGYAPFVPLTLEDQP